MDLTYPIQPGDGAAGDDATAEEALYANNEGGEHGFFPVGHNHFWHGGVHLTYPGRPLLAVADGEVLAYRINDSLREYEGPDPSGRVPPSDSEARRYHYSNGFVLIRHELITPRGTKIPFHSLYMHLRPMTKEETDVEGDPTMPPFIFQKTHCIVATDADGGGMPIIDAAVLESLGIIPFGSHFTVHPNDDKCDKERYRKIRHFKRKLFGYVLIDVGLATVTTPLLKNTRGRIWNGAPVKLYDESRQDTGRVIPTNGFFTLQDAKKDHFSRTMRYERISYDRLSGFAMLAPVKAAKTLTTSEALEIVDEGGAAIGTVPAGAKVQAHAERPPASSTIHQVKFEKIEYPDPTDPSPVEGYAFLRMGYDVTHLKQSTADNGQLHLWGENGMTAIWGNEILGETDDRLKVGQLDEDEVFDLVPDSKVSEDHWSRTSGWRRVTYEGEGKQGQPASRISGYSFVGPHVAVADGSRRTPAADQMYRVAQRSEVKALRTAKKPLDPPKNASIHYRKGKAGTRNLLDIEKQVNVDGNTRPWDGRHNGTSVRETPAATARVLTVLEHQTVVKLKAPPGFSPVLEDGSHVYAPDAKGYYELSDGGFVYASKTDVTKRAELPKPIEFNKVVALDPPIPIKRGDIVGFGGTYLTATGLTHFEIITKDRDFTTNPNGDRWGNLAVRFDAAATCHAKEPLPIAPEALVKLPARTSVRVDLRDTSEKLKRKGPVYCKVSVLPVEGWLSEGDLTPLPAPAPEPAPTERQLRSDLAHLYDQTTVVTKKGVAGSVKVTVVDGSGGSHPIPGKAGQTVRVLEHKDDAYRVRYDENEGKWGWISEDALDASTDDELDPRIMTSWFEAKTELTLSPVDPARNFNFEVPTDTARANALQEKLRTLDKVKADDGKEWIELPLDRTEVVVDLKGKRWVGVPLEPGEQVWLADTDVTRLSGEYDWLDWTFVQEPSQADKPATNEIDESNFSEDGFCDIAFLLEMLDSTGETDAQGRPLPRHVTEPDIKATLAKSSIARKRMRTLACAHPTEWDFQTDDAIHKWERLKGAPFHMRGDRAGDYDKMIAHIKEMQWWDEVPGLPDARRAWSFHPIGFIGNLKRMSWITRAKLLQICGPGAEVNVDRFVEALNDAMQKYEINSPYRQAHFLAQVLVESMFLKLTEELGANEAGKHYEGKKDLGNVLPGDGRLFVGRGLIQITGRANYTKYEHDLGEDLTSSLASAEKVKETRLAADSAGWYWRTSNLNAIADKGKAPSVVREVTGKVNGGVNHLGRRVNLFLRAIRALHG